MWTYYAHVEAITDGDTLVALVDAGFSIYTKQHLRLDGINCPELHSKDPTAAALAQKAKARLAELAPPGTAVIVTTRKGNITEKYGRLLARVQLADGRVVNDVLLGEGLAKVYDGGRRSP